MAQESTNSYQVFNEKCFDEVCFGDFAQYESLATMFFSEYEISIKDIEEKMEEKDSEAFASAVHNLKGMLSFFVDIHLPNGIYTTVKNMEMAGRNDKMENVSEDFQTLKEGAETLIKEMASFLESKKQA